MCPLNSAVYLNIYEVPSTSDMNRAIVGSKIVDVSDVVGASSVGAAQTISSFST